MYHTYSTKALVLHTSSFGDANKRLLLFTRDFGLIYVSVQSVRGHLSKLRPFTQVFSEGLFTLVRGKYGWKLVNVIGEHNHFYDLKEEPEKLQLLGRAHGLVTKFVAIEETQADIYDVLLTALRRMRDTSLSEAYIIESMMTCRILRLLGFLTDEGFPTHLMNPHTDFSSRVLLEASPYRRHINSRINTALRESGLS